MAGCMLWGHASGLRLNLQENGAYDSKVAAAELVRVGEGRSQSKPRYFQLIDTLGPLVFC